MTLQAILGSTDWGYVGTFLRDNYIENDGEKKRRAAAAKRDALYEGRGEEYIEALIDRAFKAQLTKRLRKDLIGWAKWNNVTARVVREKATVYNEPARRTVGAGDKVYQDFVDLVQMDEVMRELDHKLELHEDVWVQYRVRKTDKVPVVDLVSPANFWAVSYPYDRTQLAAIILDQTPPWKDKRDTDPHYRVWCYDETFQLDGACRVMTETIEPWALGRLPGLLATTRIPSVKGCLLNADVAADLIAAHEAVWFQGVLLLKESKSATRQIYHSGDLSAATLGQPSDTETDVVTPEGVTTQAIDRGTDLKAFRDNSDHILERAGANHGLPPSVLHHQDSSSGAEIFLRRIPLRELRRKRILVMRRVERQLCEIQSAINATELTEFAFDATSSSIDFGEVQQPMTEMESLQTFEKARQLLLTSTVEEEMRRNPDLKTPEAAFAAIAKRVNSEVARVVMMQELSALDGGVRTTPDDNTAEENGREGEAMQ